MKRIAVAWVLTLILMFVEGRSVASEPDQVFNCPLNKLYSLEVTVQRADGRISRVALEEKQYFEEKGKPIAEIGLGRGSIIDYGTVLMAAGDFGRSGYAFVRLEKRTDRDYEGYFDINLHFNTTGIQSQGTLVQISCDRLK